MGVYGAGIVTLARLIMMEQRRAAVEIRPFEFPPFPDVGLPAGATPVSTSPSKGNVEAKIAKPGCTAADESLVVYGHLKGLSRGWGGFGVLKESAKRLDRAIEAAQTAGSTEVAAQLGAVRNKLPDVHSPEQAGQVAQELDAVLPKAWELGRRCGVTPQLWQRAQELAKRVQAGDLKKEDAVNELRRESAVLQS